MAGGVIAALYEGGAGSIVVKCRREVESKNRGEMVIN